MPRSRHRSRTRLPLVLLVLALALFGVACGEEAPEDDTASPDVDADTELPTEQEEPEASDLDEGVAATVNSEQIAAETVDGRVQQILDNPEAQEQFEGQDEEMVRSELRARILTSLIANRVIEQGADDLGVEADDEDIADARAQLEEIVGGEEQLDDHLATTGITEEQLNDELRTLALLDAIGEELSGADGDTPEAQQERQQAATEWVNERLQEAEVEVDREYGAWDPNTRQVVPTGSA